MAVSDRAKAGQLQLAINEAITRSTRLARHGMRPARIHFGLGTSDVNVNRDIDTPAGWWLGDNENGISDKRVAIVRLDDRVGRPIAFLLNDGVQPSIMNSSAPTSEGKRISADLAGGACRRLERHFGNGSVALFLVGAAGDQAPRRSNVAENDDARLDRLSTALADEAIRVAERPGKPRSVRTLRLARDNATVSSQDSSPEASRQPSTRHVFTPGADVNVPIWVLQLGDIALVGLQAELSSVTGIAIKQRSPFRHTLVMTMVNGAAKYLPDAASYHTITYEALSSRYAPGSAEIVASKIATLLQKMHTEAGR